MPRATMGLTLADLEILRVLVQERPESHRAAAALVGLNRARLSRLIQRLNKEIGEDLDWRVGGHFRPPPEVRRLVSAYALFIQEIGELGRAPRVSAGISATLILAEVLGEIGRPMPRLSIVRSRDILQALECDDIDVALTHGYAFGLTLGMGQKQLRPGITALPLVAWKAVAVRREDLHESDARDQVRAHWEPGSAGEWLSQKVGTLPPSYERSEAEIPCQSFLHVIEMVRRGLIKEAVVPDIYLPRPATGLVVETPSIHVTDQLVAICRTREQPRWAWLLEQSVWNRVVNRPHAAL